MNKESEYYERENEWIDFILEGQDEWEWGDL